MKKKNYVPTREAEFYSWSKNLVKVSGERAEMWQIPLPATVKLSGSFELYDLKYRIAIDPATRTPAAVQDKNDMRKDFTVDLRSFSKSHLLYNQLLTNADRDLLGLPIPDPRPTPIPPPKSMPEGRVDTSIHLRHLLHVVDTVEVRPRGGLPDGVAGFEAWRFEGEGMPAGESAFSYVTTSTTTSLVIDYALADAGKTVWYRFRWINARNQPGPWSEMINAVIP
ncbi:MAG: hypothetical protein LBJ47_10835 [Tannerella sp.]|jgi:hypothetical protein|nr:hypothetical protein [Tannerella sp.]